MFTARSVAQSSLSYLLTYALVAFSQYSIFPWVLVYFRSRKYESWAQVTIVFGLLVSTLNGGAFLGQVVAGRFAQLSGFYYSCLAACLITSYVALAFVSRFFFIISCFWMIGLSGGMLTCFSLSIDGRFQRKTVTQPVDQSIICFAFSTLLTAFLYDNHADAEFPCFYLAVTMLVASALAIGYIVMINRMTPKPPRAISSTSKELGMPTIKLSTNDADLEGAGSDYSGSVPPNFLSSCQGNLDKARRMYGKTQAWRAKYDVDNIFSMPQPSFHTVLKYYPHAIHGISLDGCTVCYELLGKGRAKELKATGISIDELVWHFNLRNEFVFRQLQAPETLAKAAAAAVPGAITPTRFPYSPDPALAPHVLPAPVPRLMTVIDVSGISMYSITTDVLAFIQRSGELLVLCCTRTFFLFPLPPSLQLTTMLLQARSSTTTTRSKWLDWWYVVRRAGSPRFGRSSRACCPRPCKRRSTSCTMHKAWTSISILRSDLGSTAGQTSILASRPTISPSWRWPRSGSGQPLHVARPRTV